MPLTVIALSACGGGGGASTPAVLPTLSPTATPAPNPTASGDTFAYSGSLTQTFTVYGTPVPNADPSATPAPTATPWVTNISQSVTQNVTLSTGQTFAGQSGLTDLTAKETDAGQLKTTTLTSDTYLAYAKNAARANGVDVTEIGTVSADTNGASLQSVPGNGNGIIQQFPSVTGATWSNSASRTDSEKDPGGEAVTTTFAADGSYQEQLTFPEGATASALTYADGSGVYQLPFAGVVTKASSVTVNAPLDGQIQLAIALYPPGLPEASAFELPVWYPQGTPVLASDSYVDEGSTTLPSSCNAGSAFKSAAVEKVVETKSRLDTIFGEYESDRVTQYESPSYGLLCAVVNDDLQTYYDYSGQSSGAFTFSPIPLLDTAVSETLALQSAHFASMSSTARRTAAQTAAGAISVRPSLARARMIFAAVHAKHVRALYARLHSISPMRQPQ